MRLRIGLCVFFLLVLCVRLTIAATEDEQDQDKEQEEDESEEELAHDLTDDEALSANARLSFLVLGDWGKGGTSGKYGSSVGEYDDDTVFSLPVSEQSEKEPQNGTTRGLRGSSSSSAAVSVSAQQKTTYQLAVAAAMAAHAASVSPSPSFVVALGDNFYSNGVSSSTDSLWDYLWRDVYISPYPALRVPWFPVFGNHDYGGGATAVRAQLARSRENTDEGLWVFPSTNYSRRFDIPGSQGGSVAIVFVDTTTLAPSLNKCCNEKGGVSTEVQAQLIENQLEHIERMLSEAAEDSPTWLLVAGHYPIYSAGSQGDVYELASRLLPLLQKHKVHAYLCGHDHISEHLHRDGIEFFVAGAGSMTDSLGSASAAELRWSGTGFSAFAAVEATTRSLSVSFVDTANEVRYSYTLSNANPLPVRPRDDTESGSGGSGSGGSGRSSNVLSPRNVAMGTSVSLSVVALGLLLLYRRRRADKSDKKPRNSHMLVKGVDQDEVLAAIIPEHRHRNGSALGIELLELGLLKHTAMTSDSYVASTPVTALDNASSTSEGFSFSTESELHSDRRSVSSSIVAESGSMLGGRRSSARYEALPLQPLPGYFSTGPRAKHFRTQSSPV